MAEQHWVNPPEEFTRKGSDDRKDSFDNVHNQPKKQKRKLAHLQGHFYANQEVGSSFGSTTKEEYTMRSSTEGMKQGANEPFKQGQPPESRTVKTGEGGYYQPKADTRPNPGKGRAAKSSMHSDNLPRPNYSSTEELKGGQKYESRVKAPAPPSSIHSFTSVDQGVGGPRLIRPTLLQLPEDPAFLTNSQIPMGIFVQPLADLGEEEEPIPRINFGEEGPLRCMRCKTYVNPGFKFLERGTKCVCNFCGFTNQVMTQYYSGIDEYGTRDSCNRPELIKGTYEVEAPESFKSKDNKCSIPYILFVLEISNNSVQYGLTNQVIQSIKSSMQYLNNPNTFVGLITFSNNIQFYILNGEEITILTVPETSKPFVPLPLSKIMMSLNEGTKDLDLILDKVIALAEGRSKGPSTGVCTGAALKIAQLMLSQTGGKIILFIMDMPSVGLGSMKLRNNINLHNTEKEKTLLMAEDKTYVQIGEECLANKIVLDIFACSHNEIDLPTITPPCSLTGGQFYYYPAFNAPLHGERLYFELFRNLTRSQGMDIALIARCSSGLTVEDYYGGFYERKTYHIELSGIDADKSLAFILKHERKLKEQEMSVQFAMLYTNVMGERLIRIINYTFPVTDNINQLYLFTDMEAITNILAKMYIPFQLKSTIKSARERLVAHIVNIMYYYRVQVSSSSSPSQFVLPDSLKSFPLYLLCILKSNAFLQLADIKLDAKVASMLQLSALGLSEFMKKIYTRWFMVTDISNTASKFGSFNAEGVLIKPPLTPATSEQLCVDEAYIVDTGDIIYLYLGAEIKAQFVQEIFGMNNVEELCYSGIDYLPEATTEAGSRLNALIDGFRKERGGAYSIVKVLIQGQPSERGMLGELMMEDSRNAAKEFNYGLFLKHVHKYIMQKVEMAGTSASTS